MILGLSVYLFKPFDDQIVFQEESISNNFSESGIENNSNQFYQNMRYPSKQITFKLNDCPLAKASEFVHATQILSNETILDFKQVSANEEISVFCSQEDKFREKMFIAGEGGPIKIIESGNFNVILQGEILLIKKSECHLPLVAMHELLHALGFDHSTNPNNVLYNISYCKQTLGEDLPIMINKLYSVESRPDLVVKNTSALTKGKYLDLNFSITNEGLRDSSQSKIKIYVNDALVELLDLDLLKLGTGSRSFLKNIKLKTTDVKTIKVMVESDDLEIKKNNNIKSMSVIN